MKFCFQPYIERPNPTSYATWASVLLRSAPGLRTGLELELLLASTSGTRTGSTLDLLLDLATFVGVLLLHSMHQSWSYAWVSCPHHLPLDRGGVPDLSVSGDKTDLVVVDPHDPTTTSETRSANAIAEPTPDGYRPCWCKISLITNINSCTQSKNEQESEASNLNITRRWTLNYTTAARWRLFGCSKG
jgi:hypothetical protein